MNIKFSGNVRDKLGNTAIYGYISVRNIPKFKDRANWSRATF